MLFRFKLDLKGLSEEMLNRIPEWVWKSKTTTFCDPACGGGQFLIAIVKKLRRYGHSDENIRKRVFGYTEDFVYIDILRNSYGFDKVATLGIYDEKNPIHMKFDVIVGNPPYQSSSNKRWKLWVQFIENAIPMLKDGGILSYITPIAWYNGHGTEIENARQLLESGNLIAVNLNVNKHFNVGDNIGYFVFAKEKYSGQTVVINNEKQIIIDINNRPKTLQQSITDKVFKYGKNILQIKNFLSSKSDIIDKKCRTTKSNLYGVKVIHSSVQTLWYKKSSKFDKLNGWKVIINLSGTYWSPKKKCIYVTKNDVPGRQCAGVFFSDKSTAESAERILTSKLYRFVIESNKTGGFNTAPFKKLPDFTPELLKCKTDKDIYSFFGLTSNEIQYIESVVKD